MKAAAKLMVAAVLCGVADAQSNELRVTLGPNDGELAAREIGQEVLVHLELSVAPGFEPASRPGLVSVFAAGLGEGVAWSCTRFRPGDPAKATFAVYPFAVGIVELGPFSASLRPLEGGLAARVEASALRLAVVSSLREGVSEELELPRLCTEGVPVNLVDVVSVDAALDGVRDGSPWLWGGFGVVLAVAGSWLLLQPSMRGKGSGRNPQTTVDVLTGATSDIEFATAWLELERTRAAFGAGEELREGRRRCQAVRFGRQTFDDDERVALAELLSDDKPRRGPA